MINVCFFISSSINAPNGAAGFVRRLYSHSKSFESNGIKLVGPFCGVAASQDMVKYSNSFTAKLKKLVKDTLAMTRWGTLRSLYLGGKRHAIEAINAFDNNSNSIDVAIFNDVDVLAVFINHYPDFQGKIISIEHDNGVFGQMLLETYPNVPANVIAERLELQCNANDLIVFVGECNRARFAYLNSNAAYKTRSIHLGIDDLLQVHNADADVVLPNRRGALTLISTGTICDRKNQLSIIRAIAQPGIKGKVSLILLGNGPDYEQALKLSKELGVSKSVSLPGTTENVTGYLHKADSYICASKSEGLPTAILEAMAVGLPIITTKAGAAEEAVSNGNGMIIKGCGPVEIAGAIEELLKRKTELKDMGAKSRELFERCYTSEVMCSELSNLICEIVGEVS